MYKKYRDTLRMIHNLKLKKMNSLFFVYTCGQLYPDMPEDILNNIRAFARNQSASSLMQMMQSNHTIDIILQKAEPILNIINMNNSTIHHNQDSNQTVSHTTDYSQNRFTAHTYVKTLNPPLTFITLQPACSAFSPEVKLPPYFKQYSKGFEIAIKTAKLHVPIFNKSNFRIWQPFNFSKIN